MANRKIKHCTFNLGNLLEGTVSQIFYLGLSFYFMTKNGKLFVFFENLIF